MMNWLRFAMSIVNRIILSNTNQLFNLNIDIYIYYITITYLKLLTLNVSNVFSIKCIRKYQ